MCIMRCFAFPMPRLRFLRHRRSLDPRLLCTRRRPPSLRRRSPPRRLPSFRPTRRSLLRLVAVRAVAAFTAATPPAPPTGRAVSAPVCSAVLVVSGPGRWWCTSRLASCSSGRPPASRKTTPPVSASSALGPRGRLLRRLVPVAHRRAARSVASPARLGLLAFSLAGSHCRMPSLRSPRCRCPARRSRRPPSSRPCSRRPTCRPTSPVLMRRARRLVLLISTTPPALPLCIRPRRWRPRSVLLRSARLLRWGLAFCPRRLRGRRRCPAVRLCPPRLLARCLRRLGCRLMRRCSLRSAALRLRRLLVMGGSPPLHCPSVLGGLPPPGCRCRLRPLVLVGLLPSARRRLRLRLRRRRLVLLGGLSRRWLLPRCRLRLLLRAGVLPSGLLLLGGLPPSGLLPLRLRGLRLPMWRLLSCGWRLVSARCRRPCTSRLLISGSPGLRCSSIRRLPRSSPPRALLTLRCSLLLSPALSRPFRLRPRSRPPCLRCRAAVVASRPPRRRPPSCSRRRPCLHPAALCRLPRRVAPPPSWPRWKLRLLATCSPASS